MLKNPMVLTKVGSVTNSRHSRFYSYRQSSRSSKSTIWTR